MYAKWSDEKLNKKKKILNRKYKSLHVLPWIFQSSLAVHSLLSLASAKELQILEQELLPSQTGPRHFLNMTVFSPQKRKIQDLFSKIRFWQFSIILCILVYKAWSYSQRILELYSSWFNRRSKSRFSGTFS